MDKPATTISQTTNPVDFDACAQIMYQTDPWLMLGMDYETCRKAFDGSFREVFILKKNDELIGFVIMQPLGSFKGYIQSLAVSTNYRGGGYGTQLLQFCEDRILTYSPNIFICVSALNTRAFQLYQRFGFELIGEIPNFMKMGFNELLMRKTVGSVL